MEKHLFYANKRIKEIEKWGNLEISSPLAHEIRFADRNTDNALNADNADREDTDSTDIDADNADEENADNAGKDADKADEENTDNADGGQITRIEEADEIFVKGENKKDIEKILNQVHDDGEGEIFYPYVKHEPGSLKWEAALLKEKYDKWRARKEPEKLIEKHLFYASKRIKEIEKWGNLEISSPLAREIRSADINADNALNADNADIKNADNADEENTDNADRKNTDNADREADKADEKQITELYREEMTAALDILKNLKLEANEEFVKLWTKYNETLAGHREKRELS